MHGVTACGHRSLYDPAVRVFNKRRLKNRSRAAYDGLLKCLRRIWHRKGYVSHAVAVQPAMFRDVVVGFESARQHQPDVSLLENKRHAIAQTRLKSGVSYRRKAKRGPVIMSRLRNVADIQLDVVKGIDPERIDPYRVIAQRVRS